MQDKSGVYFKHSIKIRIVVRCSTFITPQIVIVSFRSSALSILMYKPKQKILLDRQLIY